MTPKEFELYRRLLFLSVIEASRNVARTTERPDGASERAWNRWEAGTSPIPESVADNLLALMRKRQQTLDDIARRLHSGETVVIPLTPNRDVVARKLNQSIAAAALAMGAKIEVAHD